MSVKAWKDFRIQVKSLLSDVMGKRGTSIAEKEGQ